MALKLLCATAMLTSFRRGCAPCLILCTWLSGCATANHTAPDRLDQDDTGADEGSPTDSDGDYITGAPVRPLRLGDAPQYPMDDGAGDDAAGSDDDINATDDDDSGETGSQDEAAEGALPPPASDPTPVDSTAERIIAQATSFAWAEDVLFALAPTRGVAALDLSDPSAMRVLGTVQTAAPAHEMIALGESLLVLEHAVEQDTADNWTPVVKLEVFDASDPENLALSSELTAPGEFVASRRVGDVLYLVTSDGCDHDEDDRRLLVTSYDVSDEPAVTQIGRLTLSTGAHSLCHGSVAVSASRLYIARSRSGEGKPSSQVYIVDISDPGGDLVEGPVLDLSGNISALDEHADILRLLSRDQDAEGTVFSRISLFAFADDGQATLTGDLQVAESGSLDVTFQGARAFGRTNERTGTLLTFDLSDPTEPLQVGELPDLGSVLSLELQDERVYALSIRGDALARTYALQLIDVSQLDVPTLLSEVRFGDVTSGDTPRSLPLLDQGLVAVFESVSQSGDHPDCSYEPAKIQLVEVTDESLTLGGSASAKGPLTHAMFHADRLLTLGGHGIETFDVSVLDAVEPLDQYVFSRVIRGVVPLGNSLLRLGRDGDVDATTLDGAGQRQGTGDLPLPTVDQVCTWGTWGQAKQLGDVVYLPRFGDENHLSLSILVIDVADPQHPVLARELLPELPEIEGAFRDDVYFSNVHLTNKALLVERVYFHEEDSPHTSISYEIFGLEDPLNPRSVATVDVPEDLADAGWAAGGEFRSSSVLVTGDLLTSTHFVPLRNDSLRGRYYLDRLDVSTPERPKFLDPVNVPGTVIHYDAPSGRLITSSVSWKQLGEAEDADGICWKKWPNPNTKQLDDDQGTRLCVQGGQSIHQLQLQEGTSRETAKLVRSIAAEDDEWAYGGVSYSEGLTFVRQFTWQPHEEDYFRPLATRVLLHDLDLDVQSVTEIPNEAFISGGILDGRRWAQNQDRQVFVFDASDAKAPTTRTFDLETNYCSAFQASAGRAYCGTDQGTVEVRELD